MGVVIREDKELIELAVIVVVEGVTSSTAVKDVFSNAAIKVVVRKSNWICLGKSTNEMNALLRPKAVKELILAMRLLKIRGFMSPASIYSSDWDTHSWQNAGLISRKCR